MSIFPVPDDAPADGIFEVIVGSRETETGEEDS